MGKACEACDIDRLTITNNAPIAEVALADPKEYGELRALYTRGVTRLGEFARECELRINGNPDLKQKIDNMKAKKNKKTPTNLEKKKQLG